MLGKIEGRRRSWQQKMRWLDTSPIQWTFEQTQSVLSKLRETVKDEKPGMLHTMDLKELDKTE